MSSEKLTDGQTESDAKEPTVQHAQAVSKRGLFYYIRDWSLLMAGRGSGVPKIFAAVAASLDNLPLLELSTLNQIKLRHNPLDPKGLH